MRAHGAVVHRSRAAAACAVLTVSGLVPAACGADDEDAAGEPSGAAVANTDVPAPADDSTVVPTVSAVAEAGGSRIATLIAAAAFAGGNDASGITAAVDGFADAAIEFAPAGMAASIPETCDGIALDALGEIIGAPVMTEVIAYGLTSASSGYLSCNVVSADNPEVALAYVHLAPDLEGRENWADIGTIEGAAVIDGLGDAALWSDGRLSSSVTDSTMLQLQVDAGGGQLLIQALNGDSQQAVVGEWRLPMLMLALSQIAHDLTG